MKTKLCQLRDDFATLELRDNDRLMLLKNRFETIVRNLVPTEAERFIGQAQGISFRPPIVFDESMWEETWPRGRRGMIALIDAVLEHVEISGSVVASDATGKEREPSQLDRVFVVHGHDKNMLNAVRAQIAYLGLEPIVLSEEPNAGLTIFEKFEKHSEVGYAVALLSPDDLARPASGSASERYRARQNVVLELGYFMCRPGRAKTIAMVNVTGGIDLETPSDIAGILYIPYDSANDDWKRRVYGELKAVGARVRADRY
ncbi:MAG: TIR domain-containing protein [Vulcanimicrobiaceae bacterium]